MRKSQAATTVISLLKYIVLVVLTALLVWGVSWASDLAEREVCTQVDVEVINADSTSFVTPKEILNEMSNMGLQAAGLPMNKVDADLIETRLQQSIYLESAQCVKQSNNHLLVRVKQIVPVLRVFDGSSSYYMNSDGKRMVATPNFQANVPVVQGHFTPQYPATRLLPLVEYINSDPTLKSLVTMISVRDSNNVFIVPAIYGHVVNLGPPTEFKNKFERLTKFYQDVLPYKGYNYYDTISVKWKHQVVGTKRQKKIKMIIDPDSTDNVNEDPDIQNLKHDDTTI